MTSGVDASHYQSDDLLRAAAAVSDFVFVKASDGMGTDNPNGAPAHDRQVGIVRAAKVRVGHYHFARTCAKALDEADHFLALSKSQPGDLLALDLEQMDGTWVQRLSYALSWLHRVANMRGGVPFRYMNKSWLAALSNQPGSAGLDAYPLWIATVGDLPGQPGVPGWVLHQYSTAGGIDHDAEAGPLTRYAIPQPMPVKVPPAPVEEDVYVIAFTKAGAGSEAWLDCGMSRRAATQELLAAHDRAAGGPGLGHKYEQLAADDPFWALPETGTGTTTPTPTLADFQTEMTAWFKALAAKA